jgi:hypothetical protein
MIGRNCFCQQPLHTSCPAGIHVRGSPRHSVGGAFTEWIPAFAGMTSWVGHDREPKNLSPPPIPSRILRPFPPLTRCRRSIGRGDGWIGVAWSRHGGIEQLRLQHQRTWPTCPKPQSCEAAFASSIIKQAAQAVGAKAASHRETATPPGRAAPWHARSLSRTAPRYAGRSGPPPGRAVRNRPSGWRG